MWDLIVYGVLAAAIVALFVAFAFTRDNSALTGVRVSYKGAEVFIYSFEEDKYQILKSENIEVESEDKEKLEICFYTEGKAGYNKIYINKKAKSAKITASDCSLHKDCVYTQALTANGSVPIICTPHALTVAPLKTDYDGTVKI